jgi:hypothetical protein
VVESEFPWKPLCGKCLYFLFARIGKKRHFVKHNYLQNNLAHRKENSKTVFCTVARTYTATLKGREYRKQQGYRRLGFMVAWATKLCNVVTKLSRAPIAVFFPYKQKRVSVDKHRAGSAR